MRLLNISINNYRNIKSLTSRFENINIIIGNNAQGKTSLLESIFCLCMSKSFKGLKDDELITFGKSHYCIQGEVNSNDVNKKLKILHENGNHKRCYADNKTLKRIDYIGIINTSILIPEDIRIISGESSERRRFLDINISQIDQVYLKILSEYHRIIEQRNSLLKKIKEDRRKITEIDAWNEQMIKHSYEIIKKRIEFVKENSIYVNKIYDLINSDHEKMEIKYHNSITSEQDDDLSNYEISFKNSIKRVLSEEICRGHSLLGAHRDDLVITINGNDARKFSSLGQQRSAAISLRLSAHEYMYNKRKEYPILLVDDIFSDLDMKRREKFIEIVNREAQVFITGTNMRDFDQIHDIGKVFIMKDGSIDHE